MARGQGTAVFRASVRGAGRSAARFDSAQRQIQDELVAEVRDIGDRAEQIFRDAAPRDRGTLSESIRAVPFFRAIRPRVTVVVQAINPDDGFDYLDVTRYGHRKQFIVAIPPRKFLRVPIDGRGPAGGRIVFRRSVRGVTPASDWVADAGRRMETVTTDATTRLGRRVQGALTR